MSIYQHFRQEEIETVKLLEQLVAQVESQYAPMLTHFLDPRKQFILTTLVNRTELHVCFFWRQWRPRAYACIDLSGLLRSSG
ncbi:hypothetical protein LAU40_04530 [Macrococcus armenti]|uniref:hypothetical protein n=1 Tax=Macrococcus armenti TaxID=2875764 RepID=UPI001CCED1CF|nr:hypothetical protein [Macrococcus armenti]UBH20849.1 hypothetical protein LAU40_04530 [Macrococcus armenti]